MPLPKLQVEAPPILDQSADARRASPAQGMLALKVVLSLPFFIGAAFLIALFGVARILPVLVEIALICLGFTLVLTRNFAVGASAFMLGGSLLAYGFYVALLAGVFGGHQ